MTDEGVKRHLLIAWEYAYAKDDWVEPLEVVLLGLDAEAAWRRVSPGSRAIVEIVLHLAVWNENIVERIRTGETVHPTEEWPAVAPDPTEAAWTLAKARLRESYGLVRTTIETTPLDEIQAAGYGLEDLLCRFVHSGYHLGQIVKIREATAS